MLAYAVGLVASGVVERVGGMSIASVRRLLVRIVFSLLVASVIAVLSCSHVVTATDGTACVWRSGCERIAYEIGPGLDPVPILEAMRFWERDSGGRVCFVQGEGGIAIRRVETRDEVAAEHQPPPEARGNWGGLYHYSQIWLLGPHLGSGQYVRALMVHELGHHFGLDHSMVPGSCMVSGGGTACLDGGLIPAVDRMAFCAKRGCECR